MIKLQCNTLPMIINNDDQEPKQELARAKPYSKDFK